VHRRKQTVRVHHPHTSIHTQTYKKTHTHTNTHTHTHTRTRHGQSTWNAENRVQGSSDESVLTPKGISQAEASAKMVRLKERCCCICVHTRLTAQYIGLTSYSLACRSCKLMLRVHSEPSRFFPSSQKHASTHNTPACHGSFAYICSWRHAARVLLRSNTDAHVHTTQSQQMPIVT
jgi:late competence protein required for DNA uptake (superfamily II DNA/RNA helicase)